MKSHIIAIVIVGIMLRIVLVFGILSDQPQGEDGPSYAAEAQQILVGSDDHFYFPPGTALCIAPVYAVFGRSPVVDHGLGVALTSGVVIVSVWFAVVLMGWTRPSLIVAVIASLYGHTMLVATQISSQPVTTIAIVVAVGCTIQCLRAWSWSKWLIVALALALAVLTRPASGLVAAVVLLALSLAVRRKHVSRARAAGAWAIAAGVMAACIIPVMLHNVRAGQGMAISTNNEWNLFLSNTPFTPDYKTGHFGQRSFDQIEPQAAAWLSACIPHRNPAKASRDERTCMTNTAFAYMISHPVRTLYRVSNRARGYWGMDYSATRLIQHAYGVTNSRAIPLLAYEGGSYLLVILAALSSFILAVPRGGLHGGLTLAVIIAGMLPYLLAFTLPRFHLPAIPMILPLSALAIDRVLQTPRQSVLALTRSAWWWTLLAGVLALQVEHFYHLARLQ